MAYNPTQEDLTPSGSANLVSSWLWNTSLTYPTIPDNVK